MGLGLREIAGVAEAAQVFLVLINVCERLRVSDDDQDMLTSLLRFANREHLDTIGSRRHGAHVAVDLFRVMENVGSPGDDTEVIERRGNVRLGKMIDQRRHEERLGGDLADQPGVLLVDARLPHLLVRRLGGGPTGEADADDGDQSKDDNGSAGA